MEKAKIKKIVLALTLSAMCVSSFSACASNQKNEVIPTNEIQYTTEDLKYNENEIATLGTDWQAKFENINTKVLKQITLLENYYKEFETTYNFKSDEISNLLVDIYSNLMHMVGFVKEGHNSLDTLEHNFSAPKIFKLSLTELEDFKEELNKLSDFTSIIDARRKETNHFWYFDKKLSGDNQDKVNSQYNWFHMIYNSFNGVLKLAQKNVSNQINELNKKETNIVSP